MLNQIDILKDVSDRLQKGHIPYMVTGSMAMNYYAQPRMTRDIDIIISLAKSRVEDIINLFKDDYYISSAAVEDSVANRSIFNILHNESIIKVDLLFKNRQNTGGLSLREDRRLLLEILKHSWFQKRI